MNNLLFDVWVHLIEAGPGSSHLEMMDIILKNQHFLLWKYMEVSVPVSFSAEILEKGTIYFVDLLLFLQEK